MANGPLQQHPFLRLLLPLLPGIAVGDWFGHGSLLFVLVPFACLLACALWQRGRVSNVLYGLSLFLTLFALGWWLMDRHNARTANPYPAEYANYKILIEKEPTQKPRSLLCPALVEGRHYLLYFANDSAAHTLRKGDILWINAVLRSPRNKGIPDEFDYVSFLRHRGVSGTAYVAPYAWRYVRHQDDHSLVASLSESRDDLIGHYRELGFEGDNLSVLSAVTVGYKEDLSDDIRELYAAAGVGHVLALSGLHIGFIYALLWFVFSLFWKRWRFLKLPLLLVTVALLWLFAVFTGQSSSVTRATTMFSVLALSSLQLERPASVNTLALTAFFMLLFKPQWLFDAGFQMSFMAVFAILIFQKKLADLFPTRNRYVAKIRDLFTLSTAAQIGVTPLVIYYFHQFPLHFLLTNLWIVPMVSLVIYLAAAMLALWFVPPVQQVVAVVLRSVIDLQNGSLALTAKVPYATVRGLWMDVVLILVFYALAWAFYRLLQARSAKNIILFLALLLFGVGYRLFDYATHRPHEGIYFYNVGNCPAVHCVADRRHSWVAFADSVADTSVYFRALENHFNRLRIKSPRVVQGPYHDADLSQAEQLLNFRGLRVGIVSDTRWRGKATSSPYPLDVCYVARGFKGKSKQFLPLFQVRHMLLDSSLSPFYKKMLKEDCAAQGIPCVDLSAEGMIFLPVSSE